MTFNSLILFWFDRHQRPMPWRGISDPYLIWLSEIILQQTRIAQGTDYYLRFSETFPTIWDLAAAEEEEILKLWQGLGYYSRARNMHYTARYITRELDGRFPDNFRDLLKLKGVGPYTAAAIASIAFHRPVPAIDGNAYRVMARYFGIHKDIGKSSTQKYFFELGKELIDSKRPGDYNQAVMELGATICLPSRPKCEICPLQNSCEALRTGTIASLPMKSKRTKVHKRHLNFLMITEGEKFLLVKKRKDNIWKNLYTFPIVEGRIDADEAEFYGKLFHKTGTLIHLLTHRRLEISFWKRTCSKPEFENLASLLKAETYTLKALERLPLPKPMEIFFDENYGN